jgi:predicted alpha/beta hydrolase family esterase
MGLKLKVILVPFLGAKPIQLQRHRAFIEELGFQVTLVPLSYDWKPHVNSRYEFGMKGLWTDEIEKVLNETPGDKIIFSFSNPCAAAISAIVRRRASDIKGLICDSGPSGDFYKSVVGLLKYQFKVPIVTLYPLSLAFYFGWSPNWNKSLVQDIGKLPKNFPVLTIQGWKDLLISSHQIDAAFAQANQLDRIKLNLPEAGHLNGLKHFPEVYKPAVENFLKQFILDQGT